MKKALGETKKEEKKEKMAHQKNHKKLIVKGGEWGVGVNAYGQPYHKITSVFIDASPLIVH